MKKENEFLKTLKFFEKRINKRFDRLEKKIYKLKELVYEFDAHLSMKVEVMDHNSYNYFKKIYKECAGLDCLSDDDLFFEKLSDEEDFILSSHFD